MSTSRFDFLLFENYHHATHHKFDLTLIARMLQSQGMRVAILNIYHEEKDDEFEGIPVLNLPFSMPIPNDHWQLQPKNKVHSLLAKIRFLWQQYWYFKRVIVYITPLADSFYFGSYHVLLPKQLLRIDKPSYFWGVRSNRMNNFLRKSKSDPMEALHAYLLKKNFFKNKNCRLFVSNEIIREEFISLGLEASRLVIREERCIEQTGNANLNLLDKHPSFLVIGQLRKQKNLPLTISAFKQANISNSHLYLIGKSEGNYESVIENSIDDNERIERQNQYLEYDEFNQYFSKSHFVLFADEQGESCITNGTMMEALIHHRPIICPNYNPYRFYIEKYHVGLMYKPHDLNDYAIKLQEAAQIGVAAFVPHIEEFLQTILFNKVSRDFIQNIMSNNA